MISCVIVAPPFIPGIAIGDMSIQQAVCLIGLYRVSIVVDGFYPINGSCGAVVGGMNAVPESKRILC